MFKLRFPISKIKEEASNYPINEEEEELEQIIKPRVKKIGYLDRDAFLKTCNWKTPRSKKLCESNSSEFIHEVTAIALHESIGDARGTKNIKDAKERTRIQVLMLLKGVLWPTASVILHWFHSDKYPILDFRALWSLGIEKPPKYDFEFWYSYTCYCRTLAQEVGVSMRDLDRALWQYSKDNQFD